MPLATPQPDRPRSPTGRHLRRLLGARRADAGPDRPARDGGRLGRDARTAAAPSAGRPRGGLQRRARRARRDGVEPGPAVATGGRGRGGHGGVGAAHRRRAGRGRRPARRAGLPLRDIRPRPAGPVPGDPARGRGRAGRPGRAGGAGSPARSSSPARSRAEWCVVGRRPAGAGPRSRRPAADGDQSARRRRGAFRWPRPHDRARPRSSTATPATAGGRSPVPQPGVRW